MKEKKEKKEVEVSKYSFIEKLKYSITNIKKYDEMSEESLKFPYIYILTLMAILISFIAISLVYQSQKLVKDGMEIVNQKIDTITYQNGEISVKGTGENPIEFEGNAISHLVGIEKIKLVVDTEAKVDQDTIQEYTDMIGTNNRGLIILKNEVVSINVVKSGTTEIALTDFLNKYFINKNQNANTVNSIEDTAILETTLNGASKDSLMSYFSNTFTPQYYFQSFFIYYLMYFVLFTLVLIIEINILAVVGFVITKIAKTKIKFEKIAKIAVYAFTLSTILNILYSILNYITGLYIPAFQLIYELLAYGYMILAILRIKKENKNTKNEKTEIEIEKVENDKNNEEKEED